MNIAAAIGLAIGTVGAGYLLLRQNTAPTRTVTYTSPSGATLTTQAPNVSATDVASALAQRREAMIQNLMTRSHLTRAQAEARYNQLMPAVTAALAPTSGIGLGSYYRER